MPRNIVFEHPPDEATRSEIIHALQKEHPALCVGSLGRSVLGREIPVLEIGARAEVVLFCGGVHALEWLTAAVLLQFMSELLYCAQKDIPLAGVDVRNALRTRGVAVVPCLNPDGVELAINGLDAAGEYRRLVEEISGGDLSGWQANIRGVDLNHNFDAGFTKVQQMERKNGIFGPSPRRYGGESPHSEPETQAAVAFCQSHEVKSLYTYHSQGEEIYYRYGPNTPARSRLMGEILASSTGYTLCDPEAMASHGGFKDWYIQTFSRPGFTFEIGRGKNPLPLSDLDGIYPGLRESMVFGMLL